MNTLLSIINRTREPGPAAASNGLSPLRVDAVQVKLGISDQQDCELGKVITWWRED
jgi:hypothetical protein